jgi:rhodanese-related sulfurtransferase
MKRFIIFAFLLVVVPVSPQHHLLSSEFYYKMNSDKNVIILDVRLYEKYNEERIPQSFYAGEKKVLLKLMNDKSKDISILVYGDYGERSKAVLEILEAEGFKNIYHLKYGFLEWKEQNFPVDDTPIESDK